MGGVAAVFRIVLKTKTKQKVKKIILKWENKGPQRPCDVKPFGRGTWQKKPDKIAFDRQEFSKEN